MAENNNKDIVRVLPKELHLSFSRSSGPGGQNVNKLNTRVSVTLDVRNSRSFSGSGKERILKNLSSRIDKAGLITVTSRRYRTQGANRNAAVKRLHELLTKALEKKAPRKKTLPTYASKQTRLKKKRHHSLLKSQRAKKHLSDEGDFLD